jgi:hypothetical protein
VVRRGVGWKGWDGVCEEEKGRKGVWERVLEHGGGFFVSRMYVSHNYEVHQGSFDPCPDFLNPPPRTLLRSMWKVTETLAVQRI